VKKTLKLMLIVTLFAALGGCIAVPVQPGYYEPAPVVYVPAPVHYAPPLYYGPSISFGFYGGGYGHYGHGGHRGYGRR